MIDYKIVFKGRDYTAFADCITDNNIEIYNANGICQDFPSEIDKTDVFRKFLDSFTENEIVLSIKNLNDKYENNPDSDIKRLYSINHNGCSFNGLIGCLKKTIEYEYYSTASGNNLFGKNKLSLDITLKCGTRFDKSDKGYFLLSLLLHGKLSFVDSLVPVDDYDYLFDYLLLFRYVQLLKSSFIKGFYKQYVTFHNNDDKLKGCIDFARHIRQNCGFSNGKIAYSYRENTVNNPLNKLIIAAYNRLRVKFPEIIESHFSEGCYEIINSLKGEIGYYSDSNAELIKLNSKPIYHPYYFDYESLRVVCLKILRDEGLNFLTDNENDESNGYLVYVPGLWEDYLEFYLEQEFGSECTSQYENENKTAIFTGNVSQSAVTIRPDFIIKKGSVPSVMMDAKFIPKWKDASEKNNFSDVIHDYNKCIRDMTSLRINKTGVIFPSEDKEFFKEYNIQANTATDTEYDKFYSLGIVIPQVESEQSFYDWNKKFEQKTKEGINNLRNICN